MEQTPFRKTLDSTRRALDELERGALSRVRDSFGGDQRRRRAQTEMPGAAVNMLAVRNSCQVDRLEAAHSRL
jgi:hypothetical protein